MTNEWKTGFEAGALWAASLAAFIANDQQVVSCICRAAGIRLRAPKPYPVDDTCFHPRFNVIEAQLYQHPSGPTTIALRRCVQCGEHSVSYLAGLWNTSTLLRTEASVPSEIEQLEKLMVRQ